MHKLISLTILVAALVAPSIQNPVKRAPEFHCPATDNAGNPLTEGEFSDTQIFCRWVTTPNDFWCKYYRSTGTLKQDHDGGNCPAEAAPPCDHFVCPDADQLNFALGVNNKDGNGNWFCSYPAFEGEDPNDFFCVYDPATGALVQDNDAGLCTPTGKPNTACPGPTRRSAPMAIEACGTLDDGLAIKMAAKAAHDAGQCDTNCVGV